MSEDVALPAWAGDVIVRAIWSAVGESPEWIAGKLDALLGEVGTILGIESWEAAEGGRWEGSIETLTDIVRSHVAIGMYGDPEPESGYSVSVSAADPRVWVIVSVSAGHIAPGRRLPNHDLTIDVRGPVTGGMTSRTADALCAAVEGVFEPEVVEFSSGPVNSLSSRGNWKIGEGYRLWISDRVGSFTQLADGLTSARLGGGTLVSAPDDWPAERVVEAMTETLAANGLDEIPH